MVDSRRSPSRSTSSVWDASSPKRATRSRGEGEASPSPTSTRRSGRAHHLVTFAFAFAVEARSPDPFRREDGSARAVASRGEDSGSRVTRDGAGEDVVACGRSGDEEARARFLVARLVASSCLADANDTAVTRAVVSNSDSESSAGPSATPGALARVEAWPDATSADIAGALGSPRGARRCAGEKAQLSRS
jgi:hypothetical protein